MIEVRRQAKCYRAQDNEEITERVAALDIGMAELVCCVRVPDEDRRRLLKNRRLTAGLSPDQGDRTRPGSK